MAPETKLNEDMRIINDSQSPLEAMLGLLEKIKNQFGRLLPSDDDFRGKSEASSLLLYLALRYNHAGHLIRGDGEVEASIIEKHHIFPRSILRNAGYTLAQIECNVTYIFLPGKLNRKLMSERPEIYLKRVSEEQRRKHMIPEDESLWQTDKYLDFLEERRRLILTTIKNMLKTEGLPLTRTNPSKIVFLETPLDYSILRPLRLRSNLRKYHGL